jgi:hypothetical protein
MRWFAKTELFQASLGETLKQGESGKVEVTTTTGEKFLLHEPITIGSDFIAFKPVAARLADQSRFRFRRSPTFCMINI